MFFVCDMHGGLIVVSGGVDLEFTCVYRMVVMIIKWTI
jgi:hypothetical protein